MGLAPENINVGTLGLTKSNHKTKKDDDDDNNMETRCWMKLRFLGSCISPRSKVDSSVSGSSTQLGESKSSNDTSRDQPVASIISSSGTSNADSTPSTPNIVEELKIAYQLRKFAFILPHLSVPLFYLSFVEGKSFCKVEKFSV